MDAKTLTPLEESIAHWERIRDGKEPELGVANCALCKSFISGGCVGCPVREFSGKPGCEGTPYVVWAHLTEVPNKLYRIAETPEEIAAAQAELDFLRSLLPKEERK